jgi:hypothetical protein
LDLDSNGGELVHTERVITILKGIRGEAMLETLVRQNHRCLSACVLVYLQGAERTAGSATIWMFHGPHRLHTNVPSPVSTLRYVDLLRQGGVSEPFLSFLVEQNRLNSPGGYWMTGHELFQMHHANIITRLLEPWQPEIPAAPPFDPQIRSR